MQTIRGHFDGKVIVLDEPADLPVGTPILVRVEPLPETSSTAPQAGRATRSFHDLIGLANQYPANPTPRFTSHSQLWEKG